MQVHVRGIGTRLSSTLELGSGATRRRHDAASEVRRADGAEVVYGAGRADVQGQPLVLTLEVGRGPEVGG